VAKQEPNVAGVEHVTIAFAEGSASLIPKRRAATFAPRFVMMASSEGKPASPRAVAVLVVAMHPAIMRQNCPWRRSRCRRVSVAVWGHQIGVQLRQAVAPELHRQGLESLPVRGDRSAHMACSRKVKAVSTITPRTRAAPRRTSSCPPSPRGTGRHQPLSGAER
jgi:hypothetical protein